MDKYNNYSASELIKELEKLNPDTQIYVLDENRNANFALKITHPEFVMGYECVGIECDNN